VPVSIGSWLTAVVRWSTALGIPRGAAVTALAPPRWKARPVPRVAAAARPAGGRPQAARQAGLEFVEKFSREAHQDGHDGAERWHAARSPASRSPAVLVELPTGAGSSSSWSCSPSPTEARPQLLGDDLDGGPAAGVAEVEPASASQSWRYVPLIFDGWGCRASGPFASARSERMLVGP
jgi:hypothetical protein